MEKYDLRDFDDFLLADDVSVKDLGWFMAFNALDVETLSLDEVCLLKLKITDKRYTPDLSDKSWYTNLYKNIYRSALLICINRRLKQYSDKELHSSFSLAKYKIKQERNGKKDNASVSK